MNAIPAKLAGCREIVMVSPPTCGGDVNPVILAAAYIAGVDRVFRCGGAQAVAALAYGTETVPRVDKIVGPGNAYVAEAKRQVFGQVAIDMIAGPSEILVVADGKSNPKWVAADLLSQAEHDKMASAVLVTDDMALARAVQAEIERQLPALPRADIARASIDSNGKIIVTPDLLRALRRGQPAGTGAPGAVRGPALRLPGPGPERRVHLSWQELPGGPGGLSGGAPTTPCPPAAPPGSPAPSAWTTS